MFNKILIANRGEIACRIIKTACKMDIQTVAVYSTADQDSLHVALADQALCIGPAAASASYLNIDAIIKAALESGAEAIHPGYGFLSENTDFARACSDAGIVFIGPTVQAMEAMASKQLAKQRLEKTSVPLTPGYHGTDQSDLTLLHEAKRLGFPVLLKAANGGGGKGMRAVHDEADFFNELAGARREAKAYFADETMLIEKLLYHPRHIEIQIMADQHGQIVHLHERDCSIQRRHQKIIEEAPASHLSPLMRKGLAEAAIAVARAIDYRGAGTVEFLVDGKDHFYFMEMNTRLQVEHPVTEMITGLDLVEWQIRIAANEPLPCSQEEIQVKGHAIECRIYAEDPRQGFLPSMGQLHFLSEPIGEGIRLDSGVRLNTQISMYYDPMMAKLIAWGNDRAQALDRLEQALNHYAIGGVNTNIPFLQAIIQHPLFIKASISTDFLSEHPIDMPTVDPKRGLLMAASVDYLHQWSSITDSVYLDTFAWQMHLQSHWTSRYCIDGQRYELRITPINSHELTVALGEELLNLKISLKTNPLHGEQVLCIADGNTDWEALVETLATQVNFYTESGPITVARDTFQHLNTESTLKGQLTAPMPATIVAILKNKGDTLKAGEGIMVLEAMKMEHTIHAPSDGLLVDIFYGIGAQVNEGAELVAIKEL
jgi:3-methylcrotonyl-CoA carboxylase alpha subunit